MARLLLSLLLILQLSLQPSVEVVSKELLKDGTLVDFRAQVVLQLELRFAEDLHLIGEGPFGRVMTSVLTLVNLLFVALAGQMPAALCFRSADSLLPLDALDTVTF